MAQVFILYVLFGRDLVYYPRSFPTEARCEEAFSLVNAVLDRTHEAGAPHFCLPFPANHKWW